jgi:hypothetical protein
MTFAHVMGIPVEESALALAPAGAAIVAGLAVVARSTATKIVEWLRHAADQDHVAFGEPASLRRDAPSHGVGRPKDR